VSAVATATTPLRGQVHDPRAELRADLRVELRAEMRAGARAMATMMVAYVPFGLLVGAAVAESANPTAAWLATWTIYGGAAHLAVLDVVAQGSGWVVAAGVGLLVNARLLAYATSMAPDWSGTRLRQRVLAGALLTDAPWALAQGHEGQGSRGQRAFYLGAAAALFVGWPLLVTVGVLGAGWIVALPVAGLLPALTLAVVVVPQLRQRPAAAAAAAAAATAVATLSLDAGLALVVSALAGVLAGCAVRERS
jgi:predicted branched-subunit amino acid permease